MPKRSRARVLLVVVALLASSSSTAQQQGGDGGGGYGNYGDDQYSSYQDYASGYQRDDLYANYAADKARGATKGGRFGGVAKLALAGVGGWIGAKIHTRIQQKRTGGAPPKLRFRVKQRVSCHMGNNRWAKGTIVKLWAYQGEGQYAPYAILLDGAARQTIYAPADDDMVIRAE